MSENLKEYSLTALYSYFSDTVAPAQELRETVNHVVALLRQILPVLMPNKNDMSDSSYNMSEFATFRRCCKDAMDMLPLIGQDGVNPGSLYFMAQCGICMDNLVIMASEGFEVFSDWFEEKYPVATRRLMVGIFEFVRDHYPNGDE